MKQMNGAGAQQRVLELLLERKGLWVPLPELARVGRTLQPGKCVVYLRRRGYVIANKMKRVGDQTHSWYMLRSEPQEGHGRVHGSEQEGGSFCGVNNETDQDDH